VTYWTFKLGAALAFVAWSGAGAALAQGTPGGAVGAASAPGTPTYLQGRSPDAAESKLAPHAPKLTVTPPDQIPLDRLHVPEGFRVELWAHGMPGARMMARGEQGTIFVGSRTIGRLYQVVEKDGERETRVIADRLPQPNGLAFVGSSLYVAAVNKVLRFDDVESNPQAKPVDLSASFDLPPETTHGWKFMAFGPDKKLYVPVGAPCNICEPDDRHAQIRRYNPDGSGMEVVARGVRNTVGFDFHPKTGELWFTDNGRDWMGNDGPEDELNRLSEPGANFGFPYCHAGGIPDHDFPKPDACKDVVKPVALTGPHAGTLGMRFYRGSMFLEKYRTAIFIARHGSWNRDEKNGFDVVVALPSADGSSAKIEPFLTGFLDAKSGEFWGRPTDVLELPDGSLLVSDEQMGAIYRVSYPSQAVTGKTAS
jgi:glucose/arabinose dehydrogenase